MPDRESNLQVRISKNGRAELLALLRENGVEFTERPPSPGVIMASAEVIEIIGAVTALVGVVAPVLMKWLETRKSRRVMVQTPQQTVVHVEGSFSEKEFAELLKTAVSVTAIQPEKDDEQ